ncbi:MAG TPA: ATP-binding cassette domain-containing protein [Roseiarcus sp.]|nr:ATP-binding cassette domain-containing protein [Roseiarcus sp.]
MREDARRLLERLDSSISPDALAGGLSIAQQQTVEIATALAIDAAILVMDEPTTALDGVDAARLIDLVPLLSRQGVTVVYISHRMPEIQAVAHRVTVLKDGRNAMTAPLAEAPTERLVRAMRAGRSSFTTPGPRSKRVLGASPTTANGKASSCSSRCATTPP